MNNKQQEMITPIATPTTNQENELKQDMVKISRSVSPLTYDDIESNQELQDEINKLINEGIIKPLKKQPETRYAVISAPIHYIPVERIDENGNEKKIPPGSIASIVDGCIEYFIPYCTSKAHLKRQYKAAKQNQTGRRW